MRDFYKAATFLVFLLSLSVIADALWVNGVSVVCDEEHTPLGPVATSVILRLRQYCY